jgi:hypothetical protein
MNSPFAEQVYLLKPWIMIFAMMTVDINYVRVFIIQLYLQPNQDSVPVGEYVTNNKGGISFITSATPKKL